MSKEELKIAIAEALQEISPKEEKATLTIQECASFTGIGRDKLLELANNPNTDFPAFKVGSRFLINKEMLVQWLEKIVLERRVL